MKLGMAIGAMAAAFVVAKSACALTPEQVGVVVNTGSEGSKLVAKHYMTARKIPDGNLLEIKVDPMLRGWSEPRYREAVVAELRRQLKERRLENKITCLALTYDVPLTVPAAGVSDADKIEFGDYEKKLRDYAQRIDAGAEKYDAIAGAAPATAPASATAPAVMKVPDATQLRQMEQKLFRSADAAMKRVEKLAPDLRGPWIQKFTEAHQEFFGPAGVVASVTVSEASAAADTRRRLQQMREDVIDGQKRLAQLADQPNNPRTRQDVLALKARTYGIVGGANQAIEWVYRLNPQESSACLDSELMLLWHDDYPKTRFMPNPYSIDAWPVSKSGKLPKLMMVARIDGVRPQSAIEMVNNTLKVEKDGLDGVAYFDARGLTSGAYEPFDRDLLAAADYLEKNGTMKVVVEKTETLMQAANCPDAALYCGWYSLRDYKESCQWKTGSVAYHVASLEMMQLHDEREKGWVVNLLRRGVCGTLGATDEPYLPAFPKPTQFFPLLMCGEFTQAEVYFVTCPWTSWRIGYVGDPLYNPFKAKPKLAVEKVKGSAELKRAYEILGALGMGPG